MKKLNDMILEELWQLFPIILKEHNPDYELWYSKERQELLHILWDYKVCRINHIGSTAVEGLIAKPIVDILLELPCDYEIDGVVVRLQENGWILMDRNNDAKTIDLNKGYTLTGFAEKAYHLHIKLSGD